MDVPLNIAPLLSSLAIGLALTLGCEPALLLWDELAVRRVEDYLAHARSVGVTDRTIQLCMRVWGAILLATPLVLLQVFGSLVLTPIVGGLLYQSPRWLLATIVARRRLRLRDQLVPVCFALANTTRAGLSLAQGLKMAAREAPEPIRSELERIGLHYARGRSLSQAVGDTAERLDLNGFRMFAAAILSSLEHGGPITETLDGLALAVQENQRLQLKMDTHSASGRLSLWVMGCFPAVFLGLNYMVEPQSTKLLLTTFPGQVLLTVIVSLTAVSIRMGLKITRFEEML